MIDKQPKPVAVWNCDICGLEWRAHLAAVAVRQTSSTVDVEIDVDSITDDQVELLDCIFVLKTDRQGPAGRDGTDGETTAIKLNPGTYSMGGMLPPGVTISGSGAGETVIKPRWTATVTSKLPKETLDMLLGTRELDMWNEEKAS